MDKGNAQERISVRLRPEQLQVLEELKEACNCSISLLVRTIILDFLVRNEDILERIVTKYQQTGEKLNYDEITTTNTYETNFD